MTDDTFTKVDALIAAIDQVTETSATTSPENGLMFGVPARLDALSISNTGIHALELTSADETDLLNHLVAEHLPQLTFHLARVSFWATPDCTGPTNFTAATIARWLVTDVAHGDLDVTTDDRAQAESILTDPRLFPVIAGTCLIASIDTAHPRPLDTGFATWFNGKLRAVGQQRDAVMRNLLGDLGLPSTDS